MREAFGLLNAFFCCGYLRITLVYHLIKVVYNSGTLAGSGIIPGRLRKEVF